MNGREQLRQSAAPRPKAVGSRLGVVRAALVPALAEAPPPASGPTPGFHIANIAIGPPRSGIDLIRAVGGVVRTGPDVDAHLTARRARAATLGRDVMIRSDILASGSILSQVTLAHEAVHVLQQGAATGSPATTDARHFDAEREADAGARALLTGRAPAVTCDSSPVLRFQLDRAQFGGAERLADLEKAQRDPQWVERDIVRSDVSDREPYTFTLEYSDGKLLVIPLTEMSFVPLPSTSGTVTVFRRHKSTGRLVPFQATQDALAQGAMANFVEKFPATYGEVIEKVPPRFDPKLTPHIIQLLNEAQMMFLAKGLLKIAGALVGSGAGGPLKEGARGLRSWMARRVAARAEKGSADLAARAAAKKAGDEAAEQATQRVAASAGKVVAAEQGRIIGWGTGQTDAAVQQTWSVVNTLTREAVARMRAAGLQRAWVEEQLRFYRQAFASGGKKLNNRQLEPRLKLMEQLLELWQ